MRIFVSEYLCSGAWPEAVLPPSLAREGRAMLLALVGDLAALPEITVCTTWDARLGEFPLSVSVVGAESATGINPVARDVHASRIESTIIADCHAEAAVFRRLAAECDATYVIAPELNELLTQRCRAVIDVGGRSLNAAPEFIAVCSDKWETFLRLSAANIPTVPSARFDPAGGAMPFAFPAVIKPRFGAGSQDTFLVRNDDQLRSAAARFRSDSPTNEAIVQPYIAGRSLSVAATFRSDGTLRELWPVGEQRLSDDGRFTYEGGRIPSQNEFQNSVGILDFGFWILDLLSQIGSVMPGLRGYIGFDLIVPSNADAAPLIVDINPRLTTSYLGYRALSRSNLCGRLLWPDDSWSAPLWNDGPVDFRADGQVRLLPQ